MIDTTGGGKTNLLEHMIRQDVKNGDEQPFETKPDDTEQQQRLIREENDRRKARRER